MAAILPELREKSCRMRHRVRLILALFSIAMTVHYVTSGNALDSAIYSMCATYWLMAWAGDA